MEWSPTSIILKRGEGEGRRRGRKERVGMERGDEGEEKREKVGVNGREIRTRRDRDSPKARQVNFEPTALFSKKKRRNETVNGLFYFYLFLFYVL